MPTSNLDTLIHLQSERRRLTLAFDEALAYSQDTTVDPLCTAYRLALAHVEQRIADHLSLGPLGE